MRDTRLDGKTQAMSLSGTVVGSLSNNDHLGLLKGAVIESGKDIPAPGITGVFGKLFLYKRSQLCKCLARIMKFQFNSHKNGEFHAHLVMRMTNEIWKELW